MEKSEGDGPKATIGGAQAKRWAGITSSLARAIHFPAPLSVIDGVTVLPISRTVKLVLPPLMVSSWPKRAIGFSFPRGAEGKILGLCLLGATVAMSVLSTTAYGVVAGLIVLWLAGGTAVVMIYNSTGHGIAFVKEMCSTCRLRPIIEEHEVMHLKGEPSEEAIWREARKKYTYDGLQLGTDPKIHSFCPIAKRLRPVDAATAAPI